MPYSIRVLPDHSWLKNKYLMCLKLGCLSLFWPSGLVCKLGGTPLPVNGETEVKLMDADAHQCYHPCINDVMKGYTEVFDENLSTLVSAT